MGNMSYTIHTDKTWHQTMTELGDTMDKWGISDWETNYPRGARLEGYNQSEVDRTVHLTYTKEGKPVTLTMGNQARAVDNLRVLYLAVEAMRLNEKRGLGEVIQDAYLQLAGPAQAIDPYELLGIRPDAPIEVVEAAYKAKARTAHPDQGGSQEQMKQLNEAVETIRKEKA
jgi:hypothetical protein